MTRRVNDTDTSALKLAAQAWKFGYPFSTENIQVNNNHVIAYGHDVVECFDGLLYMYIPEEKHRQTYNVLQYLAALLNIEIREDKNRYYMKVGGGEKQLMPGNWYSVPDNRPLVLLATIEALQISGATPEHFEKGMFSRYVFIDSEHWQQYVELIQEGNFRAEYVLAVFLSVDISIRLEPVDRKKLPSKHKRKGAYFGGFDWVLRDRLDGIRYAL